MEYANKQEVQNINLLIEFSASDLNLISSCAKNRNEQIVGLSVLCLYARYNQGNIARGDRAAHLDRESLYNLSGFPPAACNKHLSALRNKGFAQLIYSDRSILHLELPAPIDDPCVSHTVEATLIPVKDATREGIRRLSLKVWPVRAETLPELRSLAQEIGMRFNKNRDGTYNVSGQAGHRLFGITFDEAKDFILAMYEQHIVS